jgi:hypothetical protein
MRRVVEALMQILDLGTELVDLVEGAGRLGFERSAFANVNSSELTVDFKEGEPSVVVSGGHGW